MFHISVKAQDNGFFHVITHFTDIKNAFRETLKSNNLNEITVENYFL